ncbi:MAG: YlqD family protein [Kaiparowitsia implicata GSE-PSE-MK54-09C]|jgi:predicted RNase H-like nuclease (RuvC/YqgF family)|nr:YlqD family protein [Kaiparowitsia implicata GSE-PSE-MK54-09C]
MDLPNPHLLLKRPINIKVIVTPRWKEDVQQQLQAQINQLDGQLQQLEPQAQRMISELEKQGPGAVNPAIAQQISNIQLQLNQKKTEILERKNQILQELQKVQLLSDGQEVPQGQIESFFRLEKGDNFVSKLQVEIVLKDGIVEEIRGDV